MWKFTERIESLDMVSRKMYRIHICTASGGMTGNLNQRMKAKICTELEKWRLFLHSFSSLNFYFHCPSQALITSCINYWDYLWAESLSPAPPFPNSSEIHVQNNCHKLWSGCFPAQNTSLVPNGASDHKSYSFIFEFSSNEQGDLFKSLASTQT